MTVRYAGSETERNLKAAFSMESEARNKYTFFASVAKKEGYEQIAEILTKIAGNEKEHAEIWYKEIYGIDCTAENLSNAADTENVEWCEKYVYFADTADKEGFHEIADKFRKVAMIEMNHEEKLRKLLKNVVKGKIYDKEEIQIWECRNCGHLYVGTTAPIECPTCDHPQSYFEVKADNY